MKSKFKTAFAAAALSLSAVAAYADNIVEIAAADDRFSTLVAAVTAAGLAETLSGPGPFTVYAPVNDAFAALPDGTVEAHVEGPQAAVDRMIAAMHDGPPRAAPDTVDAEQTSAQGYDRFERR